jgi:hypothetical protein
MHVLSPFAPLPATPQAQALPDNVIVLHLSLGEAAALMDAMDEREKSATATPDEFLQLQRKLGEAIVGQVPAGSCTNVVQNGQPSGSNRTTNITTDLAFNP